MKQLYFIPLFLLSLLSYSQSNITLKAKVVDEFEIPISEVNIKELNSKNGTITDEDGNFEIELNSLEDAVLKFSHIAFRTINYSAKQLQQKKVIVLKSAHGQLADVVIAKRKIENPSEVITILSEDFLEQNQITDFELAADFVPGLEIYAQTANLPNYAVRGITDETITPSANSRVSVFVDGLFKSKPGGSLRSVFDAERLEVTKGPQVAKYGKGTQAGGINLIQNKAQNNTSGKITLGAGNFNEKFVNGYFNTPIVKDKLFFRVSGMHQFREGYVENTGEGEDFNSTNTFAFRTAFKYMFSENTSIDVIANYQEDSPSTVAFKSLVIPQRDGNLDRFSGVEHERAGDLLGLERYVRGVTALFNHNWGQWSLHGNAAYEKFRANEFLEVDGSPATAAVIQDLSLGEIFSTGWSVDYKGDKISSKLGVNFQSDYGKQSLALDLDEQNTFFVLLNPENAVFNGQPSRRPNFLSPTEFLGLLFSLEQSGRISLAERQQLTPLAAVLGNTPLFTSVVDRQVNGSQNYSGDVYGNFAYKITDKLKADLALRLTYDRIEGSLFVPVSEQGQVIPRPLGILTGAFPNNVSIATAGVERLDDNFLALTGSLAIDYQVSNDINVFTSVSRGRRPQGINYFNGDFSIFEEEIVWNYEAGFKGFLFDNKLSLSASAYLLRFTNFSTSVSDVSENQTGQVNFNVDDTGKATYEGFEVDFNYFLNKETTIFGNYNYIDATIDDEDVNGNRSQFAGNQVRLTPKHAFTTGFNWKKEFTKNWDLYIQPNFTFKSDIYFTTTNEEQLRQHSYGLLNFRTGVIFSKKYELNFFMRNVLDRRYINDAGNSGNQFGIPTTIAGAPRMFGFRLSATF